MHSVEAIFRAGVFEPVGDVDLPENQSVRLIVQPVQQGDMLAWLEEVGEFRRQLLEKYGTFPDSTPDIAEDRARDV